MEIRIFYNQHLLDFMAQLGLDAAPDKCQGPTIIITWIGVVFDTIRLNMAIDLLKVEEARIFCIELLTSLTIPVKKFQSFLGKLFHAAKCTSGTKVLISRLLDALATEHVGSISLSPAARADLCWLVIF